MKPEKMLEVSTRNHQMAVLRDEGLYRHIRFAQPGTSIWHFDLVTWPGHLVITGDLQDFHFARVSDMFEFFRSPVGYINESYWAEKLRGPVRAKTYSPDLFKRSVFEYFWESRDWLPGPHRPLWKAICDQLLSSDVIHDEGAARQALYNFSFRLPTGPVDDFRSHRLPRRTWCPSSEVFEFTDSWEWDFREYDYHFLVSLHAIVWGINQYDRAKAAAS